MLYADFNKDDSFLGNSIVLNDIKNELMEYKNYFKNVDKTVVDNSINLWAESIIKHNLDINMTRIDPIYLLSESNSKSVMDMFGKIMFKEKDKRTKEDFEILKIQSMVDNSIKLVILQNERDYCTELKNEFSSYVTNNTKTNKKSMK